MPNVRRRRRVCELVMPRAIAQRCELMSCKCAEGKGGAIMAYDDSQCPCTGKKLPGTMLCDECVSAFADRRELRDYQNGELSMERRRHAALILLSLARGRKRRRAQTVEAPEARGRRRKKSNESYID